VKVWWSITKVNFCPYRYGRKCLAQYIIAKASFSYVSYFISLSLKFEKHMHIGRSLLISPWDKMPPTAIPEASVRMKGFEKSGYCKTGSSHNFCFNISKDSSWADLHSNRVSFFNKFVNGLINFEKLGIFCNIPLIQEIV